MVICNYIPIYQPEALPAPCKPLLSLCFSKLLWKGTNRAYFSLAMSPIGDAFRTRLRMFPSLINCCTIDWFQSWPTDALELVANKFLEDVELDDNIRAE
jgi:hypothetical protein